MKLHLTATGRDVTAMWDHTVLPVTRHKWTVNTPRRSWLFVDFDKVEFDFDAALDLGLGISTGRLDIACLA